MHRQGKSKATVRQHSLFPPLEIQNRKAILTSITFQSRKTPCVTRKPRGVRSYGSSCTDIDITGIPTALYLDTKHAQVSPSVATGAAGPWIRISELSEWFCSLFH